MKTFLYISGLEFALGRNTDTYYVLKKESLILYKWHGNICDFWELKLFANIWWWCKSYFFLDKLSSVIWKHIFIQHLTWISLTVQVLRVYFLIACLFKLGLKLKKSYFRKYFRTQKVHILAFTKFLWRINIHLYNNIFLLWPAGNESYYTLP
jgi:hypothetical protein